MQIVSGPLDVAFYSAAGVRLVGAAAGTTLVAATTYYAELIGLQDAPRTSMQWSWDAAIAITGITYETTNFHDAGVFAAAGAIWYPETAIATLTVVAGTASTNLAHFADNIARRMRAKIVVGATGGVLRGRANHKG